MAKGYLNLVLHSHLPFVRHPEYSSFLEERWFFESIIETYAPLISVFEKLEKDGVPYRATMSVSPPLINMFADEVLQNKFEAHLNGLRELACKEIDRTKNDPRANDVARMYHDLFEQTHALFYRYDRNFNLAFKRLSQGGLELITCAATHGFLPLMEMYPDSMRAQIHLGCKTFEQAFGSRPKGLWLPECGYVPGVDEHLKDEGIRYFYVDTHAILHAAIRPKYGHFAPLYCPSGVAAFGRDVESSKQVWSADEGYPGDYAYRDFYRDIGFDLDYDYIKPYINGDGTRIFTGLKYHKITGDTDHKELYDRNVARETAASHAGNFMFNRELQISYIASLIDRKPMIVAPYDAELFGHWWFEGPQWIDFLCRKVAYDQNQFKLATPMDYLNEYPENQVAYPSASSWGWMGYNEVWLEGSNDWIYRHLHKCTELMTALANRYSNASGLLERALNQAARELLQAQASDWAFIMKTGTSVGYADRRTKEHVNRFLKLHHDVVSNAIDANWLADAEWKNNCFPNMDYRIYGQRSIQHRAPVAKIA